MPLRQLLSQLFKKKSVSPEVAPPKKATGDENAERGNWSSKLDFLLSAVGFAVGLGNVWRFPYLCYRNGGGAFLIPYTLMLALAGLPMFFLELSFGQYASLGPVSIWKISPMFKGLGYGMIILSGLVGIYYNMILAYTIFYLFASFTSRLPWSHCSNPWNTPLCRMTLGDNLNMTCGNTTIGDNMTDLCANLTEVGGAVLKPKTPAEEYWENYVLDISPGIHDLGHIRWQLALCLLLAWIVVFLCIIKGIKSVGKVVYFTALFPYVVLTILLIRGVTLPGAAEGIKFYIIPDFKRIKDPKVWGDAAVQIFYSLGPAWGGLITMASYNKFHNNCYRDAIMVSVINCGTSVYAGFAIFSVIGFMAHTLGVPIETATASGPGLAFVAYPEGLARMPGAPFWSILFFFMLWTLGLDSMFTMMETIVSALVDEFPHYFRKRKIWLTLTICIIGYLIGLVMCTQGGIYVLNLIDWYGASFTIMAIALLEVLAISLVYGYDRFAGDIEWMLGFRPGAYWKLTWHLLTPMSIIFIFIFLIVNYTPLTYNDYVYPPWANGIGWGLVLVSFIVIPIFMIYAIVRQIMADGFDWPGVVLQKASRPTADWGPALPEFRRNNVRSTQTAEGVVLDVPVEGAPSSYAYDNPGLQADEGACQHNDDIKNNTKI